MTRKVKILAAAVGLCTASQAFAGFEFNLDNGDQLKLGGYIKVDARYVDGERPREHRALRKADDDRAPTRRVFTRERRDHHSELIAHVCDFLRELRSMGPARRSREPRVALSERPRGSRDDPADRNRQLVDMSFEPFRRATASV